MKGSCKKLNSGIKRHNGTKTLPRRAWFLSPTFSAPRASMPRPASHRLPVTRPSKLFTTQAENAVTCATSPHSTMGLDSQYTPDKYERTSYYNGITGDRDHRNSFTVRISSLHPSPSPSADTPISLSSRTVESLTPRLMVSGTLSVPRFVT
jgi:hypothetical protein